MWVYNQKYHFKITEWSQSLMVDSFDHGTGETEAGAGGLWLWGWPGLHGEFQDYMIERLSQKAKITELRN